MEDLLYYTHKHVQLDELRTCVANTGYKTMGQENGASEIIIFYHTEQDEGLVEVYTRWGDYINDTTELDEEEQEALTTIGFEPISIFAVEYTGGTWRGLTPLLQAVLDCFGGFVHCEYGFYDSRTVSELANKLQ